MFESGLLDSDDLGGAPQPYVPVCWGAQLHGGTECTPLFSPGKLHFKNKFCDNCRSSIMVPLAQVRALSEEQAAFVVNKRSEGFWNHAPASMGGGQYRILNNTAGCIGPWLGLFRDQPPQLNWPMIPNNWATSDGYVRLCVAKGTLVPAKTLRCGRPQASAKRRKVESDDLTNVVTPQAAADKPVAPMQPPPLAPSYVVGQVHPSQVMAPAAPPVLTMAMVADQPLVGVQSLFQSAQSVMQNGHPGGQNVMQGSQCVTSQEHHSKLDKYKAQLQQMQSLQTGLPIGLQTTQTGALGGEDGALGGEDGALGGDAADVAMRTEPLAGMQSTAAEAEGHMRSQLQLDSCGVETTDPEPSPRDPMPSPQTTVSNRASPRPFMAEVAARLPLGTPDRHVPEVQAGPLFTNAQCAHATPAQEGGRDLASSMEIWRACQAAGGFAGDSLDVSQPSTVGTADVDGCGLAAQLDMGSHTAELSSLDETASGGYTAAGSGVRPMPEGSELEVLHSAYRHLTSVLHTLLDENELSDMQRELVGRHFQGVLKLQAEL